MNHKTKTFDLRTLVIMSMLCAISYVLTVMIRLPISSLPFLKYDPKDIVIVLGGLILGPLPAFMLSLVVSLIEMVSISDSGIIGLIMNVLSTCSFACLASFIHKKRPGLKNMFLGVIAGFIAATCVMMLWNYILTPIYTGNPRSEVAQILIPIILPFNLIKNAINASLIMLLYTPLFKAIHALNLAPSNSFYNNKNTDTNLSKSRKFGTGVIIFAILTLITCILAVLAIKGII